MDLLLNFGVSPTVCVNVETMSPSPVYKKDDSCTDQTVRLEQMKLPDSFLLASLEAKGRAHKGETLQLNTSSFSSC